ncbi:MAG: cupredoxin domain-containing protein [Myxococcales bacterium]|nr:cupredoxin domain-containing protein [Myxococcales bacterium]
MRGFRGIRGSLALIGTLSAATAALAEEPAAATPPVQVVTAVVGGKNVYIPSTIALAAQRAASLSLFNTTDKPHGFAIPALDIEVVVPEQVEQRIELPALPAGLYRIHCQLHEAHRSATLLVVDD